MSANKATVQTYIDGFKAGDHAKILGCLSDDISWEIPGAFSLTGKDAFDKEIESEGFVGSPEISITRLVEENDVVVAEGTVVHTRTTGAPLKARFCDVFQMERAKIKRLTSYLMDVQSGGPGA